MMPEFVGISKERFLMTSAASGFDQLASMEIAASGFDQLASME